MTSVDTDPKGRLQQEGRKGQKEKQKRHGGRKASPGGGRHSWLQADTGHSFPPPPSQSHPNPLPYLSHQPSPTSHHPPLHLQGNCSLQGWCDKTRPQGPSAWCPSTPITTRPWTQVKIPPDFAFLHRAAWQPWAVPVMIGAISHVLSAFLL